MSAQLENGYTKIADEILEKLYKTKLNGTQFRILLVVLRSTYGWNKKGYNLSLTYLSTATGINKQQIKREVDKLIKDGIISVIKEATYTESRVIGFNKNYSKKLTVSELEDSKLIRIYPVSELAYSGVSGLEYQKKDIKKHNKKHNNMYAEIYKHYLSVKIIKHKEFTGDMKKAIDKAVKELKLDTEHMKRIIDRHKDKYEKTKQDKYPIKKRTLSELFGQKKHNSVSLICSDYLDELYQDEDKKDLTQMSLEERLSYASKIMDGD